MAILITTEVEFIRFMYRATLGHLREAVLEKACRDAACVIGDHYCQQQEVNLESLIYKLRNSPNMNRIIWAHTKEALGIFRIESQTILDALALTNYDPAGWIMTQSERLLHDLEQIVRRKRGPEAPELYHQVVFPHVPIPLVDEYYQIVDKLDEYREFWCNDKDYIRRELDVWPPKCSVAEKVFKVQIPNYRRLYARSPSPE